LNENRVSAATIADHVIPHKGDYRLFWEGTLQSLVPIVITFQNEPLRRKDIVAILGVTVGRLTRITLKTGRNDFSLWKLWN
jgi:hypothetical protein